MYENEILDAPKKICIVEDDDNIREIYSLTLKQEGYTVITAVDGEDGMNKIREHKPDLILLDLQMPVKNGFEVMEDLKKDKEISEIPVIVFTNADDEKSTKTIGKFDTRFYVIKSLTTPKKLVGYVREALH
jgi:DNA-binding response OmpR family regulator